MLVLTKKGAAKAGDVSNHRAMPHDADPRVNVISLNLMTRFFTWSLFLNIRGCRTYGLVSHAIALDSLLDVRK